MRKRIRVIGEYALSIVVVVVLALAIAGVIVVKFHGDELEDYVITQINEQIDTRIDVDDISVKVFHKFPNTSIVITNVVVWSSHNFDPGEFSGHMADTLLTAEKVSLSFNLLRMIRKEFDIRQVEVSDGMLQLLTDSRGEGNYRMLRKERERSKGGHSIDIGQLRLQGIDLQLFNLAKDLHASSHVENLELNGKFSRRNTQIRGLLTGNIHAISKEGVLYASERSLRVRMNMEVKDSIYRLIAGQLQIDRITADVEGQIQPRQGQGVELNLLAAARDMEIHEVLDLLPKNLAKPLQQIRGNGNLEVYTRIEGMASSTLTPSVEATFETRSANLFWDRLPFSLKKLDLKGSYSNGGTFSPQTTRLEISEISATLGKDRLNGRGSIQNLLNPDFAFQLQGQVQPGQWLQWYEQIPLDEISGSIDTDIRVSGGFKRSNPKGKRFPHLDIGGSITLEDVGLRILPGQESFENISGSVRIDNDYWKPSFSGSFGSSDFEIRGTGLNLISYLTDGKSDLVASASFHSRFLDLQEILDQLPKDASGEGMAFMFPERMDLRLEFSIDDFAKEKLKARNVRGIALYESPFFFVDSLSMQGMEGSLLGSFGMAQNTEGSIHSNVDARLYSLNIGQLFEAFNNFGQNQLTSEHLKGTISGSSVFSANFDSTFRILPASILSESDIKIVDGELNRFTPILALSRFVDVKELENIRFETLENNILIRENQLIVPTMDIQSNALDLSASGIHKFNNHYEYRLKLKLSQLLYRKARQGKQSSEFEVAEDDKDERTLFLKIIENGEGAKVEWDREQASQKIRQDLKEEKSELKKVLNEELGLFKNDEELKKQMEEKEKREELFRFEFDEEEEDTIRAVNYVIDE